MVSKDERFEAIYRKNYTFVWKLFRARGVPDDQSHDLTQDTFKRLFESIDDYRGEDDAIRSYLKKIATNVLFNLIRSRHASKRRVEFIDIDDPGFIEPAAPDSPARLVRLEGTQRELRDLIGAMTPAVTVPLPSQLMQAHRNVIARQTLFREFGGLSSAEVGDLAGSKASNRTALARRWKSDRRIFSIVHDGVATFPGFQFTPDGHPLPVIAEIIGILGETHAGWELPLWFTAQNGWLGGRRPVDLLLSDPGRVTAAAKHEAEALVF